jgi:hypothetical protein
VRCEASSRARGSAEELESSGRRRRAIEDTDMKVSVEEQELRITIGFMFIPPAVIII